MKLKVYGWVAWHSKSPPAPNGNQQVRYIVAATSWSAAAKAAGQPLSSLRFNGSVTGNAKEIAAAMSVPGVVLWSPDRWMEKLEWYKLDGSKIDLDNAAAT